MDKLKMDFFAWLFLNCIRELVSVSPGCGVLLISHTVPW